MIANIHGGGSDDPSGSDADDNDATRIIRDDSTPGDDATRILPDREPPKSTPRGTVIGVAGSADDADEGKTVLMPAGISAEGPQETRFDPVVGWLTILSGPGRGHFCPIFYGQNSIGRGSDQRIQLNFGDARIARDTHAFIIYDDVARKFHVRDNGQANIVRLNNSPVLAPMEVNDRDKITIGETTLLFVALCGADFDWLASDDGSGS